jgi:hypothetical protein
VLVRILPNEVLKVVFGQEPLPRLFPVLPLRAPEPLLTDRRELATEFRRGISAWRHVQFIGGAFTNLAYLHLR